MFRWNTTFKFICGILYTVELHALIFVEFGIFFHLIERVFATLTNQIVHGNALFLSDNGKAFHEVDRQAESFVYHFNFFNLKQKNYPPFMNILKEIFRVLYTTNFELLIWCKMRLIFFGGRYDKISLEFCMRR